MASKKENTPN